MRTKTLSVLAIVVVVLGVAFFLQSGEKTNFSGDSSGLIVSDNTIYVAEQAPGSSMLVSVVRLEKPGFVVIHEDASGEPGKILGVSNLLPVGETENPPSIALSDATADGETVYAMLHSDNGDGKFDAANDKPVLDTVSGTPMMMVVMISKDATKPGVINP